MYTYRVGLKLHNVTFGLLHHLLLLDARILKKSTIILHLSFMIAKFQDDQRSIDISSIKCLNFKFLYFKIIQRT